MNLITNKATVVFFSQFFTLAVISRRTTSATFVDATNTNRSQLRHQTASDDDIRDSNYYRLEEALQKNYKPHVRPVRSHRTATNVSLYIQVVAVHEVNEAYQTLRHSSWLSMTWIDEFLTWDPDDYDGLDAIELPERMIWTPTVSIGNSAVGEVFLQDSHAMFAIVSWDGRVTWVPIGVKETLCSLDITYYPFDSQTCTMVLGMWTSSEAEVFLTVLSTQLDPAYYVENSEWRLTSVTEKSHPFMFHDRPYSKYHVSFHLERRRLFHTLTLVVPNVLLALLAGFVFLLPQECGEKMSFSMSLLLAFAVNLSVLVTAMPRSSLQVSLLMTYLTSLSVTTALSVVATVCLLKLYHKVGVMGPKVTAFTFWMRRLCGVSQPNDVTLDTDDAQNHCNDHKLRHECQTSSILSPNGTQENDILSSEWMSPDVNVAIVNNGKSQTNNHMLRDKLLSGEPERKAFLTWKDLAITLDYICFRVFVVVIVGMTSALVVALFVGK
ncbi:hypothetical protein V1264_020268 [Littorina saxatilis]|uniref:Uncharacterized protein n=2 Tax=Littorina saxatilis TaxID=31220 RepID=A0AAN9GB76_9CAEN